MEKLVKQRTNQNLLLKSAIVMVLSYSTSGAAEPTNGACSTDVNGDIGYLYQGTIRVHHNGFSTYWTGTVNGVGRNKCSIDAEATPHGTGLTFLTLAEFKSLTARDVKGFCFSELNVVPKNLDCAHGSSVFQVVAASNPKFISDTEFEVRVMLNDQGFFVGQ